MFKTKAFVRFARRERIVDEHLVEAVRRVERGLIDAELGGGVLKQRVARSGQGRSGGYRVLIAYRSRTLSVFLYGFAKNERDNIDSNELATLRDLAKAWLHAGPEALARAIADGLIQEMAYDQEKKA